MSQTLDERAHAAGEALRAAAEERGSAATPSRRPRTTLRIMLTAAALVTAVSLGAVVVLRDPSPKPAGDSSGEPIGRYRASAVLLANSQAESDRAALQQHALLVTIGVVPRRAARELHFTGDPARLAAQVHTTVNAKLAKKLGTTKLGTITITSTQPTASKAVAVVNTFAEQLVGYLDDIAREKFNLEVAKALRHQNTVKRLLDPIDQQIAALQVQSLPVPSTLEVQRTSLAASFTTATKKYQAIVSGGDTGGRYRVVETTSAARIESPHRGWSGTAARTTLIVLGVLTVLAIGYALGRRRRKTATVS